MENYIRTPKKNNTLIIFNKITELVDNNFNKLNILHKKILCKYLYRVVLLAYFYFYNDNFIEQLYLNNYQDIFSFLVLLLPYYELNTSKNITSLDELFINSNFKSKSLSSSYYIDHLELSKDLNYLEKYFISSLNLIIDTIKNIHCLLMPNWLNIFPYTFDTYKDAPIYKNFIVLFRQKNFVTIEEQIYEYNTNEDYVQLSNIDPISHFLLGYPILYGTIYNFMYMDIKPIKWMIYDINVEDKKIIPNIVYLTEMLKINMIANKQWDKLDNRDKEKLINEWEKFYKSDEINIISLKSLVLFYLRWEKDNDNINELGLPRKCLEIIKTNIDNLLDITNSNDNTDDNDEKNIYFNIDLELEKCLKKIYSNIKFENIYKYIYESVQRFKYTWYGFVCMDDNKNLLNSDDYFKKYFNYYNEIEKNVLDDKKYYYYLTPKNIYNFTKSLIHINSVDGKYMLMSLSSKWNNISISNKEIFVIRFNNINTSWFNISNNIARTFKLNKNNKNKNNNKISEIMNKIIEIIEETDVLTDIIFHTLIYNGMLSYFKYNPILTDNQIIPDKNKNFLQWESYILNKVDITPYSKSFHPFSNTMIETPLYPNVNTLDTIKKSMWYTNFGANWIAQIQLYHHYINNRVLFITGATGSGKSTVAPFLLVYAVKIINYKNDAKVVCTQPRTQPVKDNSTRIAESIGYPIIIKKDNKLDDVNEDYKKTKNNEGVVQQINYIQYKHKKGTLTDDLYHPYLRLYTDGSLYNIIKQNYLFKKTKPTYSNQIPEPTESNIFDIILVDEAHEHNTNMDLILTLSKYATYINNEVGLGIISATMDDDEIIYRKYFEPIDDNWKFPFNLDVVSLKYNQPNKNLIDRRIHLSIPFGGMNFEVKEYPNQNTPYPKDVGTFTDIKKINTSVIEILKHILGTTTQGDILIFQPGESDIKKLLIEINEQTPSNVLAIPFFSKLDNDILEGWVKKIDKPEIRKNIRYPKNKYDITQINNIPPNELLPEGTYKRFVILATNIAEASITINTFEYVIDIGNQKINIYDYNTNQSKLEIIQIAVPNQKQRKGRVGRVKPGSAYYTYDRFKLSEKVIYKLNIENISSFVLDLISTSNNKLIDENSDPYKNFDKIPIFLRNQYCIVIKNYLTFYSTYFLDNSTNIKRDASKIKYPFADGKYELKTLEDDKGEFFIIHPNEDYFERNPNTLEIINKNKKKNFFNKIDRVFEYGKLTGMIGDNNLLTPYGILVNNLSDFMEFSENSIEFTKIILDSYSLGLSGDFETLKNILMFIVFKLTQLNFKKIPVYWEGYSDYLMIVKKINSSYLKMFGLFDIFNELNHDLSNYNLIIKNKVYSELGKFNFFNQSNGSSFISKNCYEVANLIESFYQIKLKLDIIKLNEQNILKKEFKNIFDFILEQKEKNKNISNECLEIINNIMLEYINSNVLIIRENILKLNKILKNVSDTDISKKLSIKIYDKINKLLDNTSIFENKNLNKIDLANNKIFTPKIYDLFNSLSSYDKLCFVIIKNFTQNILIKVPFTEYYINYYNPDVNYIYTLEIILNKYVMTKVPSDIRNYIIFGVDMNDSNELNNIMVLNENVLGILNKYFKLTGLNLFKKNNNFNKEKAKTLYQYKYDEIVKKIDKIKEYISNSKSPI
jgi:hypothetical protein